MVTETSLICTMLKKLNTKTLVIIFTSLVVIIFITKIFDDKKGGRTFKEELVNIDTSFVNVVLVYPNSEQHKEIKLTKNVESWTVQRETISSEADTSYVRNLLGTFSLVKPQRLAATEESKWKEYNVDDSLGTRVKFLSGEKVLLDIVVGKFSFNNMTRSGISYLRLSGEEDVYAVDGFIPMAVNQPFNEWRNKSIFKGNKEDWTKISFSYPGSSFILLKDNGKWELRPERFAAIAAGVVAEPVRSEMEGLIIDSNKVDQYLNELANLSSSSFVDNYSPSSSPAMWLTIEGNNMAAPVTIKAFPSDSINQFIINSSFNTNAYFSAAKGNLTGRIFKKLPDFQKELPMEDLKGKK